MTSINESTLRNIIRESILNELDWKTSDAAAGKAEYYDDSENVLSCLNTVEEYITNLKYGRGGSGLSDNHGFNKWEDKVEQDDKCYSRLLNYVEEIRKFVIRKGKQAKNLDKLHDINFRRQHDGMSHREFDKAISEDDFNYENLTDKQKEFVDYKW